MEQFFDPETLGTAARQAGRLIVAALFTGAIGYERERKDQPAGLRTHMLVGIGACLFTLLMTLLIGRFDSGDVRADPIRVVGAITSGVAFLAAGVIIQARGRVHGLTTGASLWLAGAIGLGAGLGEYLLSFIAVVLTLIVLRVIKAFE